MSNSYNIKTVALKADEKALLSAERFSQVPVFENWAGIVDINQILTAGIDDLALMQSRHPWAAPWYAKEDGATMTIQTSGISRPRLNVTTTANLGEVAQAACGRQFYVGYTGQDVFAPIDERLIFECIIIPEIVGDVIMDWFVGFYNANASQYLTTPELITEVTKRRWGFAIDGDTNIYGIACDGVAAEVTSDHDLVGTDTQRCLKAVYDIDTGIEFFVDGVSIGTLNTNKPTNPSEGFLFFFYMQTVEANNKQLVNYLTRIRWQNGPTP